ncbi:hypothetical protein B598_0619 [Chlamydia psittaci GR9]|nr:hypothetical protein B598_0619 [Chlamydia psittaci GR9]AFS24193.1 hypothetical protein B601_0622 [Chlamydia psittaci WS/RT/E30]EPJ32191.1 hypothetical protein CP061683_2552 [Chlamydia psittaci 06-1683]EPP31588.1 hypothetical protein CPC197_0718 [Chlamydia psittaci C1/97]
MVLGKGDLIFNKVYVIEFFLLGLLREFIYIYLKNEEKYS